MDAKKIAEFFAHQLSSIAVKVESARGFDEVAKVLADDARLWDSILDLPTNADARLFDALKACYVDAHNDKFPNLAKGYDAPKLSDSKKIYIAYALADLFNNVYHQIHAEEIASAVEAYHAELGEGRAKELANAVFNILNTM